MTQRTHNAEENDTFCVCEKQENYALYNTVTIHA